MWLMCVGGIVQLSRTSELYLRSGEQLHLLCEQRVTSTTITKIKWSRAKPRRGVPVSVDDYQTIDTGGGANSPYVINQHPFHDGDELLRSELVKNNVARGHSGYYRCLALGGESSQILVTVVDSTSPSYHLPHVDSLPTHVLRNRNIFTVIMLRAITVTLSILLTVLLIHVLKVKIRS